MDFRISIHFRIMVSLIPPAFVIKTLYSFIILFKDRFFGLVFLYIAFAAFTFYDLNRVVALIQWDVVTGLANHTKKWYYI